MTGLVAQMRRIIDTLSAETFPHKRWRDKRGVVHALAAHRHAGLASGVTWVSLCGKHEPLARKYLGATTPVTCLACLAAPSDEHDEDCALSCPNHTAGTRCRTLHHCALCARRDG